MLIVGLAGGQTEGRGKKCSSQWRNNDFGFYTWDKKGGRGKGKGGSTRSQPVASQSVRGEM